jgi:hypothetical protein
MMAVLRDYQCLAHGNFEGFEAKCPYGCSDSFIKMIFLKPPGYHSDRTKGIDSTLKGLASDFGLTDMNNQNGTSANVRPDWKAVKEREQLLGKLGDTSQAWGTISKDGNGVAQAIKETKIIPDNALATVKESLVPPRANVVARDNSVIDPGVAE